MIAFVLSGAGNRGPLQVGAVRALLNQGIQPDLIVGTSAGALNACYLAAHGTTNPSVTDGLADLWAKATADSIYGGNVFQIAWRLLNKAESIYASDGVRELIRQSLPAGVSKFSDFKLPLYVTSTDLLSLRLFLFGDEGNTPIIDAVLASAAVPAIHPPVLYQKLQLVDGGVVANVPISIAMDKGATTIYAINASYGGGVLQPVDGVVDVLMRTLATMTTQSFLVDLARATADTAVDLHPIQVYYPEKLSFRDFSKTRAMVKHGQEQAEAYLLAPRPRTVAPAGVERKYGEQVGGAVEYIPPQER